MENLELTHIDGIGVPVVADLRQWRSALGLTQEQAANLLGVCKRSYVGYELGERRTPTAVRIAATYYAKVRGVLQDRAA